MWSPSLLSRFRDYHHYYAPSAPVGFSISISALSVQIFGIFPCHLPTGSPVPLISPDKVLAAYMPDTPQPLIRLHAVACLVRPPTPQFWYHDVILDTSMAVCFRSTPLPTPDKVVGFAPYPCRFPAAQYQPLEREAPQSGLIAAPESRYREDILYKVIQSLILSIVMLLILKELISKFITLVSLSNSGHTASVQHRI